MSVLSQAQLEKKLIQHEAMLQNPAVESKPDYGEMEDWTLQLGSRKAILSPGPKQWLWYMKVDNEWVLAGCGVGEAILMAFGGTAGIKKLPQPGDVSEWCIYMQEQQLFGPLRVEELINKLKIQQLPIGIRVWSTLATSWLTASRFGNEIIFTDEAGVKIPLSGKEEGLVPPPPVLQHIPPVLPTPPQIPISKAQTPPPITSSIVPPPPVNQSVLVDNATVIDSRPSVVEIFILNGGPENKRIKLGERLSIGRELDNDLAFPDQKTSRHHAIFQRQGSNFYIEDLNSSNGTFVNEKRISEPTLLKNRDIILIGDTKLTIEGLP